MLLFCLIIQFNTILYMQNDLLNSYQWKNRILLLFAPDSRNDQFDQQWRIFQNNKQDIAERDLVVFQIFITNGVDPEKKPLSYFQVEELRKRFNVAKEDFALLLIGKDGSLKNRYNSVTAMNNINERIDAMPMRRAEMEKKNSNEK